MFYSKAFSVLKKKFTKEWKHYVKHEFVNKLAKNTLKEEFFFKYLIQDYLFLIQFSKAWSLAFAKADTIEEMKLCASTVNGLINFEMDLHIKLCKSYGISRKNLEGSSEKNENIAYTRYVLENGYSGDFLDLITSLMPCVIGYAEIGYNLRKHNPKNFMYKKWIETYSGKDYQNIAKEVGRLFDDAITLRLGKNFAKTYKWKKMQKIFLTSTLLETDFWAMSLD